jgi:hypothetical protein
MSNSVNFKFGSTIENKTIADNDFVAVNKGMAADAEAGSEKYGSIYKGDKILGTTEADKLYTTDELVVTGVTVGNLTNGTKIEAGSDIMSILAKMLMKELGVTASNPTVKLAGGSTATYEKGTKISGKTYTTTFSDGSYNGVSGYSYNIAAGCSPTGIVWTGVSGSESKNGNVYSIVANDIVLTSAVTISAKVNYGAATNIPVTNFDNAISSGLIQAGSASTGSITYTPQLKWWIGSSTVKFDDMTWTSDDVRGLSLYGNGSSDYVTTKTVSVTFPKGAKQQVIAIPSGNSFTAKDGAGSDITGTFSSIQTVTVTCGGTHTETYKVYVAPANAGLAADSKATITLI